jgi:DNA-binding transcriptional MerR regulator
MSKPAAQQQQPAAAAPAVTARLTRSKVATRLGVSISTVRSLERQHLHPIVEAGVHYFDPVEVEAFAAANSARKRSGRASDAGHIAAAVFRLLDAGRNLREIVEELALEPERVRSLYREWRMPDLEEGERQRQKREDEAADQRELAAMERLADRQARQHERQMAEITRALGGLGPQRR